MGLSRVNIDNICTIYVRLSGFRPLDLSPICDVGIILKLIRPYFIKVSILVFVYFRINPDKKKARGGLLVLFKAGAIDQSKFSEQTFMEFATNLPPQANPSPLSLAAS